MITPIASVLKSLVRDGIADKIDRYGERVSELAEDAENIAKDILAAYHLPEGMDFEKPVTAAFLRDDFGSDVVLMDVSGVRRNISRVEVITPLGVYSFTSLTQAGQLQVIRKMFSALE